MKVLIVGGGALGQVYGQTLARGGAPVSYLVKPGQEVAARSGFTVHRLRRLGGPATERLVPAQVLTSPALELEACGGPLRAEGG
jgi:ketopantoate reductase